MTEVLTALLPSDLPLWAALTVIGTAYFTAALTASFGIGGGVMLLAVMAATLPPLAIIPIHGVAQFGANASRSWLMRSHVHWPVIAYFAVGSLVGGFAGGQVLVAIPIAWLYLCLGLFILYAVWVPKFKISNMPDKGFIAAGGVATFATMFVGATGPLVAAFLSPDRFGKKGTVATHSVCMTLQHALKVVVFGFVGFTFGPWLVFLGLVLAAGFVGSYTGRALLERLPEQLFRTGFKVVLTVMAGHLLVSAIRLWL